MSVIVHPGALLQAAPTRYQALDFGFWKHGTPGSFKGGEPGDPVGGIKTRHI